MTEFIVNHADIIIWGLAIIAIISFAIGFFAFRRGGSGNDKFIAIVGCFVSVLAIVNILNVKEVRIESIIETTLEEYGLELIDCDHKEHIDSDGVTVYYKTTVLDNSGDYSTLYLMKDDNGDYIVYTSPSCSCGTYSQLGEV